MTEMIQIIAEVEGIRTPTRKRTKKEIEKAMTEFTEKSAASKKAKTATKKNGAATSTKKTAAAKTASGSSVADIKRIEVSENAGNVRSAGYDPKTQRLHIEFEKSVWEYPKTTAEEWKGLKATFTDKDVDTGAYFRKAFRGRAASSRRVYDKPSTSGASKEAPSSKEDQEVKN